MDDLIADFLTETNESLGQLDNELVKLEQNPDDKNILSSIFRVMHTIKGTCGFLGLPRLASVAHASENVLGKIREGAFAANPSIISLVLESIDCIKEMISQLEEKGAEPQGEDRDLIERLNHCAATGEAIGQSYIVPTDSNSMQKQEKHKEVAITQNPDALSREAKESAAAQGLKVTENGALEGKNVGSSGGNTIRVGLDVLEKLMQMVSELVLTRNQLLQLARSVGETEFNTPLQRLSHITTDLQEGVMKTRMQPIGNAWAKFPRLIRDLSHELGKKIDLRMIGADTELDRQLLEMIKDPLTHMVRNSADHGIEKIEDRKTAGKSEVGVITLSAYHEGGHIIIKIADDGKGLNVEKIKEKVLANGLATESEIAVMSEQQIYQFIFKPGFSTAAQVTSVSGRGVGMDVVLTNLQKIGGVVELSSVFGKGTTFHIKIPLTLAIMPVLVVEAQDQLFAIPQIRIVEIVNAYTTHGTNNEESLLEHRIEIINNAPVLRLRERLLSLVSLPKILGLRNDFRLKDDERPIYIVVCQLGSYSFGIMTDKVYDTEEIVVKPVSPLLKNVQVFSGCTILGDGNVILIVDPNGLVKHAGMQIMTTESDIDSQQKKFTAGNNIASFLIFKAEGRTPKAVPLELVSRLEEMDASKIEWSGGRPVIQYRGDLMRVVQLEKQAKLPDSGILQVIVFMDEGKILGFIVDEIIDIVHHEMNVKMLSGSEGLLGSVVINDKTTDLVDVSYYFSQTFEDWLQHKNSQIRTSNNQKHILLVDDSAFFRKFMEPILSVANYRVTTADSAIKATELLNDGIDCDAIVTDIDMPEMNGIQFAELCRKDSRFHGLPIIALTSYDPEKFKIDAKDAGFNSFVSKSDRNTLVDTLSRVLAE